MAGGGGLRRRREHGAAGRLPVAGTGGTGRQRRAGGHRELWRAQLRRDPAGLHEKVSGAGSRARDSSESPGTLPRRFKVLMRALGRAAKPGARFQFFSGRGFEARQLAAGLGAKVALSQSRGDFRGRRACGPAEGLREPAGTHGKHCLKLRASAIINALFFVQKHC